MRLLAALALALCLLQSQPPSPTPGKSAQPKQQKAAPEQQERAADDNPTPKMVPIVEQPTTKVTIWNEHESAANSKGKPAADWWSRLFSGAVALFTLALAILALLQWRVMGQQRVALEKQAGYMLQQWERMGEQLMTAKRSARAARKSANAAKRSARALMNAERAWITTEVQLNGETPVAESVSIEGITLLVNVCLKCRNDGGTPAWITDVHIHLRNFIEVPPVPDFSEQFRDYVVPEEEPIAPSNHWKVGWELDCDGPRVSKNTLLVYGFIKYRDVFCPERETRFAYYVRGDRELLRLPGEKFWEYNKYT